MTAALAPFISTQDLVDITKRTADNEAWTIALDSACQMVRDFCHQSFNLVEDDVVLLEGTEAGELWLPERPVIDVTAVNVNWKGLDQDYASDSLMVSRRGRLQIIAFGSGSIDSMLNGWGSNPWGGMGATIRVTYSHGYATTEAEVDADRGIARVPSSVRRIAAGVAERLIPRTTEEARDEIGFVGTDARVLAPEDAFLREDEEERLKPYRVPASSSSMSIESA